MKRTMKMMSGRGDDTLAEYESGVTSPERLAAIEQEFNKKVANGYFAVDVTDKKDTKILKFDPDSDILLIPPMQGGAPELTSIWDGWEHQAWRVRWDGGHGRCALGWLDLKYGVYAERHPVIAPTLLRVAKRLKQMFPGLNHHTTDASVIAGANDTCGMTPEKFRQLDRETQLEEFGQKMYAQMMTPETPETPPEPQEAPTEAPVHEPPELVAA